MIIIFYYTYFYSYNESKYIAASVYHLAIAVAALFLFSFSLSSIVREVSLYIAGSFAGIVVCFATLTFIFGPKLYEVFYPTVTDTMTKTSVKSRATNALPMKSPKAGGVRKENVKSNAKSADLTVAELEKLYSAKVAKLENDKSELAKLLQSLHMLHEEASYSGSRRSSIHSVESSDSNFSSSSVEDHRRIHSGNFGKLKIAEGPKNLFASPVAAKTNNKFDFSSSNSIVPPEEPGEFSYNRKRSKVSIDMTMANQLDVDASTGSVLEVSFCVTLFFICSLFQKSQTFHIFVNFWQRSFRKKILSFGWYVN